MPQINPEGFTMLAYILTGGFFALFVVALWAITYLLQIRNEMRAIIKKVGIGVLVALAVTPLLYSKPKTRTFHQACTVVFPVAEKMSSEKPYHLLLDGKQDMILRVETGSFWKAGAADIDVQFSSNPEGTCTVTDNSPYSGVRKNGTVFLDRL